MHDGYTYIHHMKQKHVPTLYGFIILWFVLLFVLVALVQQQQIEAQSTLAQPTDVAAYAGNAKIRLVWGLVTGATKYQYQIKAGTGSYSAWTDVGDGSDDGSSTADETSIELTALPSGTVLANSTTYSLKVRGHDGTNEGTESTEVTAEPSSRFSACGGEDTATPLHGDCEILLAAKDTLRGTATLNWAIGTAISNWEGVRVGNRVSHLGLNKLRGDTNQLTGSIPAELGSLSDLQLLEFRHSQLTGPIPPELGNLTHLRDLYLDNNRLTGTIPP